MILYTLYVVKSFIISPDRHLQEKIEKLFHKIINKESIHRLERVTITVAILSFLGHMGLIAATRVGLISRWEIFDVDILVAIATPFTIILIYEAFLVLGSIAVSIPQSVGKQYQVISLIVMRNIFKDLSKLGSIELNSELFKLVSDMGTTLLLFVLVAIYYYLNKRYLQMCEEDENVEMKTYSTIKKLATILALALVLVIGTLSLIMSIVNHGDNFLQHIEVDRFLEFTFNVLILTDVFLLVLSSVFHDKYEIVIRNGALIVSTIILRIAITDSSPLNNVIAIAAMLFGICSFYIYSRSRETFLHTQKLEVVRFG